MTVVAVSYGYYPFCLYPLTLKEFLLESAYSSEREWANLSGGRIMVVCCCISAPHNPHISDLEMVALVFHQNC
jgi:hypothetical protein